MTDPGAGKYIRENISRMSGTGAEAEIFPREKMLNCSIGMEILRIIHT